MDNLRCIIERNTMIKERIRHFRDLNHKTEQNACGGNTTLQDKVYAYCEAIHSQNEKEFEALWSQTENCTLISIGNVCARWKDRA